MSEVEFRLYRRCRNGAKHNELERAILENRIRLECLISETTQRSRAPHGASVLRTVGRSPGCGQNEPAAGTLTLQINCHPGFLTQSPAKLPRYSGLKPLKPYLAQVDLAALHDGWSREETATYLVLALEGPALQVLIGLSLESGVISRPSLLLLTTTSGREPLQGREELTDRHRREGERVGAFTADIRVYARKGYPTFLTTAREELSLPAFLRGLTPGRLCQHVCLLSPRDLSEALREVERAEEVLQAGLATGQSPLQRSNLDLRQGVTTGWTRLTSSFSDWMRSGGSIQRSPPAEVQIRLLLSLRRTGEFCQGLPRGSLRAFQRTVPGLCG